MGQQRACRGFLNGGQLALEPKVQGRTGDALVDQIEGDGVRAQQVLNLGPAAARKGDVLGAESGAATGCHLFR
jgi:hypothetical protein